MPSVARFARPVLLAVVLVASASCEPEPCCSSDEDCGAELGCFDGRCTYECIDDDECLASEVCVRPLDRSVGGVCVEPGQDIDECIDRTPPDRAVDGGADAGARDAGLEDVTPPPECFDDAYEDNDSRPFATNNYDFGDALTICEFDEDWFNIRVREGDRITVRIEFEHVSGNLGLEIYAALPQGGLIDASLTSNNFEEVSIVAARTSTYAARVFGGSGAENRYRLFISINAPRDAGPSDAGARDAGEAGPDAGARDAGPQDAGVDDGGADAGPTPDAGPSDGGAACFDDTYEPNDNRASASENWPNPLAAWSCPGDEDWYVLRTDADGPVDVELTLAHPVGNLDVAVYSLAGTLLAAGTTAGGSEQLAFVLPSSGAYVRVYSTTTTRTFYSLQWRSAGVVDPDAGPLCFDDSFENNDTFATATSMYPSPLAGTACPGDDDYYAVFVSAGWTLDATASTPQPFADLEVWLHDSSGTRLTGGLVPGTTSWLAEQSGLYYVSVRSTPGAVAQSYVLDIDASPPGPVDAGTPDGGPNCQADVHEPNNSLADASVNYPNIGQATICGAGDRDWYAIFLPPSSLLQTSAVTNDANLALRLSIVDANGNVVSSSEPPPGQGSALFLVASGLGGQYYFAVEGAGVGDYDYSVEVTPLNDGGPIDGGGPCTPDAFEPNDSVASPTTSTPSNLDASICESDDEDYFRVVAQPALTMFVTIRFPHSDGDLDLELLGMNGQVIDGSYGVGNQETVSTTHFFPEPIPFTVRVYGFAGATNEYTLEVSSTPPPPQDAGVPDAGPGCEDDFLEPNDDRSTASSAWPPGPPVPLEICPGDEDWFLIPAQAGQTIEVRTGPLGPVGDLDIELYGPGGALLASSTSPTNTETIIFTPQFSGDFLLRVYGWQGAVSAYTLAIDVTDGPPPCIDDPFEDNDNRNDATPFAPDADPIDGIICPDDPDIFVFDAEANAEYGAFLDYGGPPGMRLTIQRPGQGVVASSATGQGFEEVSFVSEFAGPVYVRISGVPLDDGQGRPYLLDVFRFDAPCEPDALEEDDTPQDSTLLLLPSSRDATACLADPDFFAVLPGLSDTITVTLDTDPDLGLTATVVRLSDFTFLGFVQGGSGPSTFDIGPAPSTPITIVVGGPNEGPYALFVD